MRPDTAAWWRQAQADMRSAEVLFAAGQYYGASFFAQQAAEKALKAILVERQNGRQPPRTHDLVFLGQQVLIAPALQPQLTLLFPVFGLARYPMGTTGPVDAIGEQLARSHVAAATQVVAWTAHQL